MHRSLSSYLSNQADNRHDRRIPDETRRFIAQVAAAERAMARDEDAIATAKRTLDHAYLELADAYGALRALDELVAAAPTDPLVAEHRRRAYADVRDALDWIEECRLAMSTALRQAQQDAVRPAERPAGAAA